jgi:hypothetical protein
MRPTDRLCPLADSLPATIRWRFCDYEELLKKELQLLVAPPARERRYRARRDGGDPRLN